MSHNPWSYFLALEKQLIASIPYCEIHPDNSEAFSVTYTHLVVGACLEAEAILKAICADSLNNANRANIAELSRAVLVLHPGLPMIKITVPRFDLEIEPWMSWGGSNPQSPRWWRSYNALKHDRFSTVPEATQCCAVESLAGLYAALLYRFGEAIGGFGEKPDLLHYPDAFMYTIGGKQPLVLP